MEEVLDLADLRQSHAEGASNDCGGFATYSVS
jgi:hypothetical protein